MAEPPSDPPEDIPAWFMTYSDVITLLMTFFILLLTFSTTEPERFEKVVNTFAGDAGATGIAGHPHEGVDRDSWSKRVRPRAARIAMHGSEMPSIVNDPLSKAVGEGLKAVDDEDAKKDVMNTYSFQAKMSDLVDEHQKLTQRGEQVAGKLASQLRHLPIHLAIELSDRKMIGRATAFAHHLYHSENVRPGQVAVGLMDKVETNAVLFTVERYEP
ncbi:MAG: flagellar motor protein MotB [Planctomycetota bacterium]